MPRETPSQQIAQRLAHGEDLFLLDVREPWEVAICRIPDAVNIPMGQVPGRLADIPTERTVVCICHHGMRSLQVASFLEQRGLTRIENLTGGVEAWASQVDPAMPRY